MEADTYLCTYHGPASEGLRNDEAQRRMDIPETRAELLKLFGGNDDDEFREYLKKTATTSTTLPPRPRGLFPSAWAISGASPWTIPAVPSLPASTALPKPNPANRRDCC